MTMSVFAGLPKMPVRAALELAKRGVPVFPCNEKKRPMTASGFKDATCDAEQIKRWWQKSPNALIGIPTGERSGLDALDFDRKHGDPDEMLDELQHAVDAMFRGPRVRTISNGLHQWFKHDPRIRIGASRFRVGVDWRGEGGYAIAPDGLRYHLIADGDVEPWPEALVEMIVAHQGRPTSGPQLSVVGGTDTGLVIPYQRTTAELVAGTLAAGQWHDAMIRMVAIFVSRGFSMDEIIAIAPMFQRPGWSEEETVREVSKAAEGAFEKWGYNPAGEPRPEEIFGERLIAGPFDQAAIDALQPREWLYSHLSIRRFVSVVGAPGGVGKTAFTTTVALALASGRPLLGEPVHKRSRVWLYNLEDPLEEQYRRLDAAMRLHGIKTEEVKDWLFLTSGREQRLCMAIQTKEGMAALTPHVDMMVAELKLRGIDVPIIDPFVKSHQLSENDNVQIDAAATAWANVAEQAKCAPLLVHHFRKGSNGNGDADQFRGASALIDAARAAVSLSPMSDEEATRLGVDDALRLRLVRLDNAKLNLAPRPEETTWLELRGVQIGTGDNVQAVRRWAMPSIWAGVTAAQANAILDRVDMGFEDGEPWSADKQAKERWVVNCISAYLLSQGVERNDGQCAQMVRAWLDSGALKVITYTRKQNRREAKGLEVIASKRPSAASWDME
jgi:hypothetical protein